MYPAFFSIFSLYSDHTHALLPKGTTKLDVAFPDCEEPASLTPAMRKGRLHFKTVPIGISERWVTGMAGMAGMAGWRAARTRGGAALHHLQEFGVGQGVLATDDGHGL